MVIKKKKNILNKKKTPTKKVGVKKVPAKKVKIIKKTKIISKSKPKAKKVLVKKVVSKKLKPKLKPKSKPKSKTKKVDHIIPSIKLNKPSYNPIFSPGSYSWESQAVFNPGVVISNNIFHLFYRALGDDGISRIGYASSYDGINFQDRLPYPVYFLTETEETKKHWPFTSPALPVYSPNIYASGGGWGGCEDPRVVVIDGDVYITFNVFNATNGWKWDSMRVAVVSIKEKDLWNRKWYWKNFSYLSHLGDRQKNWVLFPEKFNGKFAVFHNLDKGNPNEVYITYTDKLDWRNMPTVKDAPDPQVLPDHIVAWHKRTRSASAPPIKTKDGWLLLYHAMDKDGSDKYKLGAMLLDLKDPSKVLCRAGNPILESDQWYENDWKPGVIYASGAVVKDGKLFVYYGGGDKYVGVASIQLQELIDGMKKNIRVELEKNKKIKIQ